MGFSRVSLNSLPRSKPNISQNNDRTMIIFKPLDLSCCWLQSWLEECDDWIKLHYDMTVPVRPPLGGFVEGPVSLKGPTVSPRILSPLHSDSDGYFIYVFIDLASGSVKL